jgi:hypothetical protein
VPDLILANFPFKGKNGRYKRRGAPVGAPLTEKINERIINSGKPDSDKHSSPQQSSPYHQADPVG